MFDWWVPEYDEAPAIEAAYALRDMYIDSSIADDMDMAALANLLIEPTSAEFDSE